MNLAQLLGNWQIDDFTSVLQGINSCFICVAQASEKKKKSMKKSEDLEQLEKFKKQLEAQNIGPKIEFSDGYPLRKLCNLFQPLLENLYNIISQFASKDTKNTELCNLCLEIISKMQLILKSLSALAMPKRNKNTKVDFNLHLEGDYERCVSAYGSFEKMKKFFQDNLKKYCKNVQVKNIEEGCLMIECTAPKNAFYEFCIKLLLLPNSVEILDRELEQISFHMEGTSVSIVKPKPSSFIFFLPTYQNIAFYSSKPIKPMEEDFDINMIQKNGKLHPQLRILAKIPNTWLCVNLQKVLEIRVREKHYEVVSKVPEVKEFIKKGLVNIVQVPNYFRVKLEIEGKLIGVLQVDTISDSMKNELQKNESQIPQLESFACTGWCCKQIARTEVKNANEKQFQSLFLKGLGSYEYEVPRKSSPMMENILGLKLDQLILVPFRRNS